MYAAYILSTGGDIVFDTTMMLWVGAHVAAHQNWAPAAASGVLLAAAVPTLLVGPLAGAVADRADRPRVMVNSSWVQAAATSGLLVAIVFADRVGTSLLLATVYLTIAVTNAAGQFFRQSRLSMIATLVPADLRTTAFAATMTAQTILSIFAPPAAALLLKLAGASLATAIQSATFVFCAALFTGINWGPRRAPESDDNGDTWSRSIADGFRAICGNRPLLVIAAAITVVTAAAAALNALELFFITDVLRKPASLMGLFAAAFSLGSLAGAQAAPGVERRLGAASAFAWAMTITGLAIVAYSRSTTEVLALLLFAVAATPLGVVNTVVMPFAMAVVPERVLGRALMILTTVPECVGLLATGFAGWLASGPLVNFDRSAFGLRFGPIDTIFTACGLIFTAVGIATVAALRRPSHSDRNGGAFVPVLTGSTAGGSTERREPMNIVYYDKEDRTRTFCAGVYKG